MTETSPLAHQALGTDYGADAKIYAGIRHGPDGEKFLDPFFQQELDQVNGLAVVDIGTGAAPWAIYAAQKGAQSVVAVDIQRGMLTNALAAVNKAELNNSIQLAESDGAALPLDSNSTDVALSITVGCNLPTTATKESRLIGFEPHFSEIARILKQKGRAIVTAPTSFGEVFTSGLKPKDEILSEISSALKIINESDDKTNIPAVLKNLTNVFRATFAFRDNQLVLITNESELDSGEDIWRKLPGLAVPNRYHASSEYESAFQVVGLSIVKKHDESFSSETERAEFNAQVSSDKQLGPEYIDHAPFSVWVVQKD